MSDPIHPLTSHHLVQHNASAVDKLYTHKKSLTPLLSIISLLFSSCDVESHDFHVISKRREKCGKLKKVCGGGKEKMSLWVDKYRPSSLSKLDYHKDQAKWLTRLVSSV